MRQVWVVQQEGADVGPGNLRYIPTCTFPVQQDVSLVRLIPVIAIPSIHD